MTAGVRAFRSGRLDPGCGQSLLQKPCCPAERASQLRTQSKYCSILLLIYCVCYFSEDRSERPSFHEYG